MFAYLVCLGYRLVFHIACGLVWHKLNSKLRHGSCRSSAVVHQGGAHRFPQSRLLVCSVSLSASVCDLALYGTLLSLGFCGAWYSCHRNIHCTPHSTPQLHGENDLYCMVRNRFLYSLTLLSSEIWIHLVLETLTVWASQLALLSVLGCKRF